MTNEHGVPKFRDPTASDETLGFDAPKWGSSRLPGSTWTEGNMFTDTVLFMPNLNMDDAVLNDKVWQYGQPHELRVNDKPEHRVLNEIFYNNAVRRLQAIEQLTLPPQYTTIPNTAAFSRTEHIWGSVLFVRQMSQAHRITGRDSVRLQLRTLVSDIAHTFGSHLGDWMFQGVGGAENQHDLELKSYLGAVGIGAILEKHGYELDEVVFPDINDWVEASQPDLCVDRVDYGLREMNRWNFYVRRQAFKADDFTITPDNMLAMKDQQKARVFAEGFLLLSQEHWSEPTHRFMIDMLMMRTKLFYGEGRAPRTWVFEDLPSNNLMNLQEIHPRDLMYVTDPAQEQAYAMPDLAGHTLEAIMTSVARYRRQYVWPGRKDRIEQYMSQFADDDEYGEIQRTGSYTPLDSSKFDTYLGEYPVSLPTGFAVLDAEVATATRSDTYMDFPQPPFKTRQIDPLVQDSKGFSRLSEMDPSYAERLAEHKKVLLTPKVARLAIADPKTLALVSDITENVEASWQYRVANSRRMTPVELNNLVSVSAREIHGAYPFMTFFEY